MLKLSTKLVSKKTILITFAAVVVFSGGTALAAQSANPGDFLYGVKLASENVRSTLSLTSGMKKSAQISMANERIKEIQTLLAEKGVSAPGIQVALDNLNKNRDELNKLAATAKDAQDAQEIETEASQLKSEVDGVFAAQQKTLEIQRESLKQQFESASKSGDTVAAHSLMMQINAIEPQLKQMESDREAAKQQLEMTQHQTEQMHQQDQQDQQQQDQQNQDN